MTTLEYALKYLAKGWSIIPIPKGSKISTIKWKNYTTKFPTIEEVTKWWTEMPDANIALITGKISGVICIDIDKKSGGMDTAKGIELPPTLCSKTGGGGNHYIYKWKEGLIGNGVGVKKGVDIRSDNGYIIISPSVHPSGNIYEWIYDDETIVDAPSWLESGNSESPKKKKKNLKDLVGVSSGSRNEKMASFIGKLLLTTPKKEWDSSIWPVVMQTNATYKPPLETEELAAIYESICSTESKRLDNVPKSDNEDEATVLALFNKGATNGTYALAEYIVKKYNIITIGESEREMYVYQNGMYKRAENEIIFPEVQRVLRNKVTKSAKSETFHKIADATAKPRDVFTSAPVNLIPVRNGVYDIETQKLLPHSPEYKFTFQFPVTYDPQAKSRATEAFLAQILSPEQILTVQEWLGYYFYRLYMFKKAIIFVGEGDTGKTTLLETIISLIGKENTASVSLHKMVGDKFSGAQMYEKHGNIVDELSAIDISDTGIFKIATGGGTISGERKFGNQFSFLNYAKLTFACNKIPDVKDFDDIAYFNRWMVIRFDKTIEKKIPNFIASITTETERSGLFNFAMTGLTRLLSQGGFTYSKSATDTKLEMMKSGSSIAQFVSQKIEQKAGEEISKETMYEAYTDFCVSESLSIDSMKLFGTRFQFYVPYASEGHITTLSNTSRPERVRGWRNVAIIKSTEGKKIEIDTDAELESLVEESKKVNQK